MARFYGTIQGRAESQASREGSTDSGLTAHVRGWDLGIRVYCHYDATTDEDVIEAYETAGSNGDYDGKLVYSSRRLSRGKVEA